MHIIKQRRKELNDRSLAELSSRTGVPKQTLSDIESGLYLSSPEVAHKMQQALQIQGLPDSSQILSEREIRSLHPADSLAECLAHCSLLHAGTERVFISLGLRRRPILNPEGLALADGLLSAYLWNIQGRPCLLWPQVTLLSGVEQFRLDYLAFYRGQWFNIEIDGPGHNWEDHEYRRCALGLPEIRISHKSVTVLQFPTAPASELEQRTHHVGLAA
jgi:DNA-binding XRE family transcriptional regulator